VSSYSNQFRNGRTNKFGGCSQFPISSREQEYSVSYRHMVTLRCVLAVHMFPKQTKGPQFLAGKRHSQRIEHCRQVAHLLSDGASQRRQEAECAQIACPGC
jgi:hypothetical protein